MFHEFNSPLYFVKAHTTELICEASRARQAQELKLNQETQPSQKQKKAFFFSFGPATTSNR
jgi:hypothetical protein